MAYDAASPVLVAVVLSTAPATVSQPTSLAQVAQGFPSIESVYNWLEAALLRPIWNPPPCGDGVCEFPEEFPAWGRCVRPHERCTLLSPQLVCVSE
eukprot:scaffold6997_cov417-Prasinococcus_capsulatus_cf.AAC.3